MTADPFAKRAIPGLRDACLKGGASFIPAGNYSIAGLKLSSSRGFGKTNAYGGGATANRNNNSAQLHLPS